MKLILLMTAAVAAFSQTDNTITITASRTVAVAADQVLYQVTVSTDVSATLDGVIGQLAGTGISPANLVSAASPQGADRIDWYFSLVIPFSKMKDTTAALANAKQKLGAGVPSWSVDFGVISEQVSADALAQACPLPALVSDARREAERIAPAAGMRLGSIVGLGGGGSGIGGGGGVGGTAGTGASVSTPCLPPGISSTGTTSLTGNCQNLIQIGPGGSCSLVVQFRLL